MNERREKHRSTVSIPFKVSHESFGTLTIHSRDISMAGIFALHDIESEIPEPGSVINVQVVGLAGADQSEVQAEVVRVDDGGFGLKFLYVDYDNTEAE